MSELYILLGILFLCFIVWTAIRLIYEIIKEWLRVRKYRRDPVYRAIMKANEIFKKR